MTERDPKRYQVYRFDDRVDLVALFSDRDAWDQNAIAEKPQIKYLNEFCAANHIRSIVDEKRYVDRHFSEDYGAYFVKCYGLNEKKCSRFHYFQYDFDDDSFPNYILSPKTFGDVGYRGFSVIKPLPQRMIGRTCIAAPVGIDLLVKFRTEANLFGRDFAVCSLPFQEQDKEVAACATNALWTSLHATSRIFDHAVPTPLEITKIALSNAPLIRRTLPNEGLDIAQMASVVREFGLETDLLELKPAIMSEENTRVGADSRFLLQAAIAAYMPLGIAPILGCDLNLTDTGNRRLHAMVVSGAQYAGKIIARDGFHLKASEITSVFVHDDQVGPYTELKFRTDDGSVLACDFEKRQGIPHESRITDLLVPLYQQIRIHLFDALEVAMEIDGVLSHLIESEKPEVVNELVWEIYLSRGTDLKRDLLKTDIEMHPPRLEVVKNDFPRYIWRLPACSGGEKKFELVLDATDLRQGNWRVSLLLYDKKFSALCRKLKLADFDKGDFSRTSWAVLDDLASGKPGEIEVQL